MLYLKKTIFIFTSIIISLKYRRCLEAIHSTLFWLKLNIPNTNCLKCNNASIVKSKIQIRGIENVIIVNGKVSKADILIVGANNRITFENETKLFNSRIVLRGNNCEIKIGKNSTFGSGLYMVCMGNNNRITIGEQCMFADNIELWNTDSHPIKDNKGDIINPSKPVTIGNNVWIGKNSTILKGVNIADGVVVGMLSTVTKDLPSKTVCIGSPAKPIKNDISWERSFITE